MKRMRTKIFFMSAAVLLMAVIQLSGQEKQWTLTECINYALDENIQVRKADVSVSVGEIIYSRRKTTAGPVSMPLWERAWDGGRLLTPTVRHHLMAHRAPVRQSAVA